MDIQPQTTQALSDDQELAKVLAGVSQQVDDKALDFEETPVATPASVAAAAPGGAPEEPAEADLPTPAIPGYEPPVDTSVAPTDDLEGIKKEALGELRPLVDKLDLAPEEKFDTYLLLLRSTDDKALIPPAYAAAQSITDESRKAQALLDVIKEIDYLSTPKA
jgi:hypothetical protein